jgi:hypothetical protein
MVDIVTPQRLCLFLCQLHDQGSPPSPMAEVILQALIRPAIQRFDDFTVHLREHDHEPGSISEERLDDMLSADLLIADLGELGSSGYFEIGFRQAADMPLVLIADTDHVIPFDFSAFHLVRYSPDRIDPPADEVDALAEAIREALSQRRGARRFGPPPPKRSLREQRAVLAERIEEAAEAIQLLRINSVGETVDELKAIAEELRQAPDDAIAGALKAAAVSALDAVAAIFDQLATVKGSRILISGILASLLGGLGWPSAAAFGLALAGWQDKATFLRALEIIASFRLTGSSGKTSPVKRGRRKS